MTRRVRGGPPLGSCLVVEEDGGAIGQLARLISRLEQVCFIVRHGSSIVKNALFILYAI